MRHSARYREVPQFEYQILNPATGKVIASGLVAAYSGPSGPSHIRALINRDLMAKGGGKASSTCIKMKRVGSIFVSTDGTEWNWVTRKITHPDKETSDGQAGN